MADDDQGLTPFTTSSTDPTTGQTQTLSGYGPRRRLQGPTGGIEDLSPGISAAFRDLPIDEAIKATEAAIRFQGMRGYQRDLQGGKSSAEAFAKWGPLIFRQATGIPEAITRTTPPPISPQQMIQNQMNQQRFKAAQDEAVARQKATADALEERKRHNVATESKTKGPSPETITRLQIEATNLKKIGPNELPEDASYKDRVKLADHILEQYPIEKPQPPSPQFFKDETQAAPAPADLPNPTAPPSAEIQPSGPRKLATQDVANELRRRKVPTEPSVYAEPKSKVERATALRKKHPDWSKKQIVDAVNAGKD